MPTPASDQNEPSKMRKLISGNVDDSIRSRLPHGNDSRVQRVPASSQRLPDSASSDPKPRARRFQFLPAFWTIASLMSITVNVILIVILLLLFQMLGMIQGTANDKISGLLGGLYMNFVKMDQASIQTNIHVEKQIPVKFDLNVSGPATVSLTRPTTINGATVSVHTGGLTITDANATIILPGCPIEDQNCPNRTVLPIYIQNLVVPVNQQVMAALDVPVNIPLNQTQLHEPFVGLQKVVEPWYCLVEPNAMVNGVQVCSPFAVPASSQTVVP